MDGYDSGTDIKVRARAQFSALSDVWPNNDTWSRHTHTEISRRLHHHCKGIIPKSGHSRLLNIGSHGNDYGIIANEHIHIDLVADALIGVPLAAAADRQHRGGRGPDVTNAPCAIQEQGSAHERHERQEEGILRDVLALVLKQPFVSSSWHGY